MMSRNCFSFNFVFIKFLILCQKSPAKPTKANRSSFSDQRGTWFFQQYRKIKENIPKRHEIGEPWKLIFWKASIDILRKLVYAVRKAFKICRSKDDDYHFYCIFSGDVFDQGTTPLHAAAAYGDFKFFNRNTSYNATFSATKRAITSSQII